MRFVVDEKHWYRDDADERAATLASILRAAGKPFTFVLVATPRGIVCVDVRETKA
jgi:hypothetical protein